MKLIDKKTEKFKYIYQLYNISKKSNTVRKYTILDKVIILLIIS